MNTKLYKILFEEEEEDTSYADLMPSPEDRGEPRVEPMDDEEMSDWLKSRYYKNEASEEKASVVNETFEGLYEEEGGEETPTTDIVVTPSGV